VTELETIWENVVVLMGACFLAGLIGKGQIIVSIYNPIVFVALQIT
jgi:hypothetical protein